MQYYKNSKKLQKTNKLQQHKGSSLELKCKFLSWDKNTDNLHFPAYLQNIWH